MTKLDILKYIAEEIRNKYGEEPGIFHELGQIVVEGVSKPNAPIIPEEVTDILLKAAKKFNLKTGDLVFSTNNGNILISFSKNNH